MLLANSVRAFRMSAHSLQVDFRVCNQEDIARVRGEVPSKSKDVMHDVKLQRPQEADVSASRNNRGVATMSVCLSKGCCRIVRPTIG
jgi:hypothetical protein